MAGTGNPNWVKGVSGNPSGRPKNSRDIQALARTYTAEALQALRDALANPKERVPAAIALLDRGYGKPGQTIDINHNTPASAASDEALLAIALSGSSAAAAQEDDPPEPSGMVH